jgi:Domain of Unknown Function (DUF1080)
MKAGIVLLALAVSTLGPPLLAQTTEEGFLPIFDGTSLKGWHVSSKSGHSRASGQRSGGRWVVEDGAVIGSQDVPGNGGLIITEELFGDFEIVLEMKNDFGPDSGLFLRSTEEGRAYQAMIDYHANGNLMGIYGEGMGAKPHVRNFSFLDAPDKIKVETSGPTPLPVSPADWPGFWQHGRWNEFRVRISGGATPTITTWINRVKFMEWTETEKRHPAQGGIALQVHGGGDTTKQFVRYRKIRVKRLDGSGAN